MDTEAVSRFAAARGYLEAIKMICTSPHMNSEGRVVYTILPLNMLAGFALELYFKSWLLLKGRPSKEVRAYGHKVGTLFSAARNHGLPDVDKLDQVVESLGPGHEDFTYRYINSGDEISLIKWELAIPALDSLDDIVHVEAARLAEDAGIVTAGAFSSLNLPT